MPSRKPAVAAPVPARQAGTPASVAAGTRERLVTAMSRALQRRGYHGVGLAELLAEAEAPKGVLYHHFPGGKQQLAVAAIEAIAAHISASLERLVASGADPLPMLEGWLAMAEQQLVKSGFERGCPLATVALETTVDDVAVRAALAAAFAAIRERLARLLAGAGVPATQAAGLAALVVAAYEGALMQARVAGSGAPMTDAAQALLALLRHEIERVRQPGAAR
jgi:TetR/AcrR family transcriptional regulator, lmrAB and yxaGH operons repressor